MLEWLRISTAVALIWAVAALTWQVVVARGGGRRDFSRGRGSPARGVAYNFTAAMAPSHKESARYHPVKFGIGILLHIGTVLALADVLLLVVAPAWAVAVGPWILPPLLVALLSGGYLCVRRMRSPILGAMSSADDFVAILAVIGLLALSALHAVGVLDPTVLLVFATLLFLYLPLGKLRHAAFFFAARADFGRRMGHRGSYPVSSPKQSHVG